MCMHIYIYTLFFMSVCGMYVCVYTLVCIYTYVCVLYHQPLVSACGCNVIISTFALNPYKPQWEIAHKSQLAVGAISSLFAAGNGKAGLKCIFQCDKILSEAGGKKSICSYISKIFEILWCSYISNISSISKIFVPKEFRKKILMSSRNQRWNPAWTSWWDLQE